MDQSILLSHLTSAAIFAYILQLLQQWTKLPWVTKEATTINIVIRAILSFLAILGITTAWTGSLLAGGTLTIDIPSIWIVLHGLYHFIGQFALQHAWLKIFYLDKPAQPQP